MGDTGTDYGWWDGTWQPFGGCRPLGRGCDNCYATKRAGTLHRSQAAELYLGTTDRKKDGRYVFNGKLTVRAPGHPEWDWPLTWPGAEHPWLGEGQPSLIFVGSMADLFAEKRDQAVIDRVVATIVYSRHIGLMLNKGVKRMAQYFSAPQHTKVLQRRQEKLWLGFSAEDQQWFDRRWAHMRPLAASGWTVFVSVAPMLGPVTLPPDFMEHGDWVICSAERAPAHWRRPLDLSWARALREQCAKAGVPFFMLTGGTDIPDDLLSWEFPRVQRLLRD